MEIRPETADHYKLRDQASAWPTPKATDPKVAGNNPETGRGMGLEKAARLWPTPNARDEKSPGSPTGKRAQRKKEKGWTTDLNDAATWATPASRDYRHGQDLPNRRGKPSLPAQVTRNGKDTMVLNPLFVEALMGFPSGWTVFEPLGTEWSRWWLLMRSELLRLGWGY
jgi:DNA (cytosine-5)-methyltransferase 1